MLDGCHFVPQVTMQASNSVIIRLFDIYTDLAGRHTQFYRGKPMNFIGKAMLYENEILRKR